MRKLKTSRSTGRKPHADKAAGWQFSRRLFLAGSAGLALAAGRPFPARSAPTQIIMADWGGASTEAFKASWVDLLRSKYNIDLVIDFWWPFAGQDPGDGGIGKSDLGRRRH